MKLRAHSPVARTDRHQTASPCNRMSSSRAFLRRRYAWRNDAIRFEGGKNRQLLGGVYAARVLAEELGAVERARHDHRADEQGLDRNRDRRVPEQRQRHPKGRRALARARLGRGLEREARVDERAEVLVAGDERDVLALQARRGGEGGDLAPSRHEHERAALLDTYHCLPAVAPGAHDVRRSL